MHRLLENGLVVPAIFHARSKSKYNLNVYLEELKKLITLCKHIIELSNTDILKIYIRFQENWITEIPLKNNGL